jgi:hypothetical protein
MTSSSCESGILGTSRIISRRSCSATPLAAFWTAFFALARCHFERFPGAPTGVLAVLTAQAVLGVLAVFGGISWFWSYPVDPGVTGWS